MSDQKLDEMIAKADVDNNGWVQFKVQKINVLIKGTYKGCVKKYDVPCFLRTVNYKEFAKMMSS